MLSSNAGKLSITGIRNRNISIDDKYDQPTCNRVFTTSKGQVSEEPTVPAILRIKTQPSNEKTMSI